MRRHVDRRDHVVGEYSTQCLRQRHDLAAVDRPQARARSLRGPASTLRLASRAASGEGRVPACGRRFERECAANASSRRLCSDRRLPGPLCCRHICSRQHIAMPIQPPPRIHTANGAAAPPSASTMNAIADSLLLAAQLDPARRRRVVAHRRLVAARQRHRLRDWRADAGLCSRCVAGRGAFPGPRHRGVG